MAWVVGTPPRGADSAVVASPYFVETDGDTYEGLVPFLFAALPVERCPRVASHEGGQAFPIVGIRRWRNLRPEGCSRRHHIAVLRFDHGSRPIECRHSEERVEPVQLAGGRRQVPGMSRQLGEIHVYQRRTQVHLTPGHGER